MNRFAASFIEEGFMQLRITRLLKGKMRGALCVPLMSVLIATSLMGQEGLSTLRGTISDKSGAVVAGVACFRP